MAKEVLSTGIAHNALAFGSIIKGEIITDNDIRIDGTVEGNINSKGKVVIGPKGNIVGNINCANAEIIGSLNGDLRVYETLTIRSTGKIYGDINTEVLVIEPNAIFCGFCTMGEKPENND
jgi:cytoskeletal protein CcmA (bactofilin family)